jgi:hypothetical protein
VNNTKLNYIWLFRDVCYEIIILLSYLPFFFYIKFHNAVPQELWIFVHIFKCFIFMICVEHVACMGKWDMYIEILSEILKERAAWETGVHGRTILKWIVENWCVKVWSGFPWFKIVSSGILLWTLWWTFWFCKSREFIDHVSNCKHFQGRLYTIVFSGFKFLWGFGKIKQPWTMGSQIPAIDGSCLSTATDHSLQGHGPAYL